MKKLRSKLMLFREFRDFMKFLNLQRDCIDLNLIMVFPAPSVGWGYQIFSVYDEGSAEDELNNFKLSEDDAEYEYLAARDFMKVIEDGIVRSLGLDSAGMNSNESSNLTRSESSKESAAMGFDSAGTKSNQSSKGGNKI